MTPEMQHAIDAVAKAQVMTTALLARDSRDHHLFVYAEKQLDVMSTILAQGRIPTDDEKSAINVGRMAIREFEGGPLNDYALALEEAAGAFHTL